MPFPPSRRSLTLSLIEPEKLVEVMEGGQEALLRSPKVQFGSEKLQRIGNSSSRYNPVGFIFFAFNVTGGSRVNMLSVCYIMMNPSEISFPGVLFPDKYNEIVV